MRRCKKCGGTEFVAHQRVYTDIVVDGDNQFMKNHSENDSVAIYESENPYGPYKCCMCGAEYDDLQELPDDETEFVGYIHYFDSDEKIGYRTEEELIRKLEDVIAYLGSLKLTVDGIADTNLVLKYKVYKIFANEYGVDTISFEKWIRNEI